jgi:hypothetical protein
LLRLRIPFQEAGIYLEEVFSKGPLMMTVDKSRLMEDIRVVDFVSRSLTRIDRRIV